MIVTYQDCCIISDNLSVLTTTISITPQNYDRCCRWQLPLEVTEFMEFVKIVDAFNIDYSDISDAYTEAEGSDNDEE